MDKESNLPSASLSFQHKHQRSQRKEPSEPHTASTSPVLLPNPYLAEQTQRSMVRNQAGGSVKQSPAHTHGGPAGKAGDASRSHGYSSSRRARHTGDEFMQRDRSLWDPPAKTSVSNRGSPAQVRLMGKNPLEAQRKGFRDVQSALNSAGKSKPAQADLAPFEVKMTDFPELAGISLGKAGPPPVQTDCWGPTPPSTSTVTQVSVSSWRSGRGGSPTRPDVQQISNNTNRDSSASLPGQTVVTSWANVASQPPKKPVFNEKTISNNHLQMEEATAQQEDQVQGKKKRKKKKKKAKGADEDTETEVEQPAIYQEPPKFEDEEEFPGLALAGNDRLRISSNVVKLCNEENQREDVQHQPVDKSKEKTPPAKKHPTEAATKGQKADKVSGKKSKVPVQLDIGNMLATLEKKQQSQKAKKPVILSVGGGLAVVQKELVVSKKVPWQPGKIAHNPLDSTGPGVKKGKQREVPKVKKPTPLKKVILKEREERKQRRLLEERGLLPEHEPQPATDAATDAAAAEEEDQCEAVETDEVGSPTEELDVLPELNGTSPPAKDGDEETDKDETCDQETISTASCQNNRPKIHSRKFRDYCSQMLSKEVDKCVTALLKELVRFQDRLYQRDPMKARMRRRIVMGLREVLKHLKLRKVKCVVISPNCERIQSKGGLDEALYTIIDTCREQGVPYVFALSRKALGRCVNKAVPVSLVGIFNYDGAQDFYHQMIELSSEARKAYEAMVSSLEETGPAEAEQVVNAEDELQNSSSNSPPEEAEATRADEPEYIKAWKKMLEKDCNHKYLNFEEQLSALHLESECTENTEEDERS